MELTTQVRQHEHEALQVKIRDLSQHLAMMDHTLRVITQLWDAAHADLAAVKREVDLIDTPELRLGAAPADSATPPAAPADLSRRSPAKADSAVPSHLTPAEAAAGFDGK